MHLTKRILRELTNGPGDSFEIAAAINRPTRPVQDSIWGLQSRKLIKRIGTVFRTLKCGLYNLDERDFDMAMYAITDKGMKLLTRRKKHGRSRYNKNRCRCEVCVATMRMVWKRKEARRKQRAESAQG